MEKPERIILDEPSNALDEKSEETLWQIVREEKERRALILISCHTTETLEKEVPITYLSLETTDVGTAISQELLMGNSEHYGSMVEKLEPGEEKVVTYPYEICSIWFHKKDWKNIEMRSFWMTFSSYPDKIVLYL